MELACISETYKRNEWMCGFLLVEENLFDVCVKKRCHQKIDLQEVQQGSILAPLNGAHQICE